MASSRARHYAALRRRGGVARGSVPGSPWSPSPFYGVVGWALFFATIAVVVFGVVTIAAPRTAAQIESSPRWYLPLRVAIALWLLPLAWWAWTIAKTGMIRSRNLVELWWLRGSYGFALGYGIATWLTADHGRRLFFRAHGLASGQVQWAELGAGVLGIVAPPLGLGGLRWRGVEPGPSFRCAEAWVAGCCAVWGSRRSPSGAALAPDARAVVARSAIEA